MSLPIFDQLWHRWLRRPYQLAKTTEVGEGTPVILLHGIGRTGKVWEHVVRELSLLNQRVVTFDLLGFGASPKPNWVRYDIDDHAAAVIASIDKLKPTQPLVIVGHSMGCLVAVRVARLRPDLVRHLVLFEMPLYEGLPQKAYYRMRTNLYFKFYDWVIRYQPGFDEESARRIERLARKIVGFEVTRETWQPFIKSLRNTIMQQTADQDIPLLTMPMDVIYGSYDMLVIRGELANIFGSHERISRKTIPAGHSISLKSSRFIASRIVAALRT